MIDLLDASRMNATVCNEVFERHSSGLTAHRIETGEDDGLGSIVDHEIDARDLLKRTDVTAFATDDTTLEVIGGNMHRGDRNLRSVISGAALDSEGDDFLSGLMAFRLHALLGFTDDRSRLMGHFRSNLVEELAMRIIARELSDALKLAGLLIVELVELAAFLFDLSLLA